MSSIKTKTYQTSSSEETKHLGEKFAADLLARRGRGAAVVILSGELGAGKTTFVQGLLRGAGIRGRAPSPTFVIMRHYRIPRSTAPFSNIIHMDAYRLKLTTTKKAAHLAALEFDEIVGNPKNILLIEWGERIKSAIPKDARHVRFRYDKEEGQRTITIK
jgi:tRNA threonylcarbamoyladenosine biosynthesis protein TsaE